MDTVLDCGHTLFIPSWRRGPVVCVVCRTQETHRQLRAARAATEAAALDQIFATDSSDDARQHAATTPERQAELTRISAELQQRNADIRAYEDQSSW